MKSKVTLINIISSLTLQVVTVISGFIIPKIILTNFGSSVNGLVSSLNQFLSYITLIEGGITGVVLANLYKPLVDHDDKKISAVLVTAKKFFNKIGYAEKIATENGWKIVEISLRATNAEKPNRRMFYEAGVEEFLSLVKYAECVITNSFHGMIFAVQYCRPFYVFSREQCDTKITELLDLFGLSDHMLVTEAEKKNMSEINYEEVHSRIAEARKESLEFLNTELTSCV